MFFVHAVQRKESSISCYILHEVQDKDGQLGREKAVHTYAHYTPSALGRAPVALALLQPVSKSLFLKGLVETQTPKEYNLKEYM